MTDDIPPNLKYRIIWADLSDQEAASQYGVLEVDVHSWRKDYGRWEDTLEDIREKLERERFDAVERVYWLDIDLGLRFFLGLWFGRPIGGDRISNEAYDDLWRSRTEYLSGAYGGDSRALLRWCVEVGRTLREGALKLSKPGSNHNSETF